MAQQHLNLGTTANDGTGDPLRTALQKAEANFTDLYASEALKAPLASPAFTGTPTAPTAAPGTSTTQIATTAFVSAIVTGLWDLKTDVDCSANPNYPAALKGDAYAVSVAGKIGGASGVSVDIGDVFVAKADNAGGTQASVGASWFVLEHNLAGALLSANNLSDLLNAATARSNLGLGSMATQAASSVAITGGSVAGITDIAVADGGTGASTASAARTNLGLAIGSDVQAFSAALALYAAITPSANVQSLLGAANYAAMRTLLTLVVGTDVQAHDTDLDAIAALAPANDDIIQRKAGAWANRTLAQFRTDLDILGNARPLVHSGYVAGRWYWAPRTLLSNGVAQVANTIRLNPIILPQAITLSDLAAKVTTVSAGGNFQIAVYAADAATKMPTGAALAATGNISTATAAVVSADITGADVALQPGLYWVAVNSDNSVVVLNGNLSGHALETTLIGTATLANLSGASNNANNPLTVAQTFGTWPNLTSASFTEAAGTTETAVAFKVSSVP